MLCVRETPQIKMKPASDVEEKLLRLKKNKNKKTNKKTEGSMGCVRETPHKKKFKQACDV